MAVGKVALEPSFVLAGCWLGWLRLRSQNYKARGKKGAQEFAYIPVPECAQAGRGPIILDRFIILLRESNKRRMKKRMERRYREKAFSKKFSSLNASASDWFYFPHSLGPPLNIKQSVHLVQSCLPTGGALFRLSRELQTCREWERLGRYMHVCIIIMPPSGKSRFRRSDRWLIVIRCNNYTHTAAPN